MNLQGFTQSEGFSDGTSGKETAYLIRRYKRRSFSPQVRKIPWSRTWQSTPVFLPGESHGQRSLVGYSPWGHKELGTTEATQHACTHAHRETYVLFCQDLIILFSGRVHSFFPPSLPLSLSPSLPLVLSLFLSLFLSFFQVQSQGWEDYLEKGAAMHSSILA